MLLDTHQHARKLLRLDGHDYSKEGAYFITIVTYQRECLFGDVVNGEMTYTLYGNIACVEWFITSKVHQEIELFEAEFVIMPNHIHGIVWIPPENPTLDAGAGGRAQSNTNNSILVVRSRPKRSTPLHEYAMKRSILVL